MSVDALQRPVRRQEGRRGLPARTLSEQSQLDDILQDLLADPMFLNNSRSYEWANDAEGTYGSISPQHGSITTHSGHGGRTVVSWQMNKTGPKNANVAVTRRSVDRPYVESESSRRIDTTARPASVDRLTGGRFESRRVEARTEATSTRRDGMIQKAQPPSPPVRRMFSPESFNHSSPARSAPVPPPRREVPPPETSSRTPMHFQSAPSTPSTPHRNYFMSDTEDGPTRWGQDEQRSKTTHSSRQTERVFRVGGGPTTVVQSDTEDYFRPPTERRPVSRNMVSPIGWTTNATDDPNLSDRGLSPRRSYGSQSSVPSPYSKTYDIQSGRLYETKKTFYVSGIERPAHNAQQTRYTFSVSPQRSLAGDEFPSSAPRSNRPPPRPITPRSCTSPVLPPLRTDSSREAVMRVTTSRDFVSPKPTRDVHSPTLDELEKSLQDFHSMLQPPTVPKPAPSPTIDDLVIANKLQPSQSAVPQKEEEEEEEEVISLQPIGPGVQNLEPNGPIRPRSVTPAFPGFRTEAVSPITPPFHGTQQTRVFSSANDVSSPTKPAAAAAVPSNDISQLVDEFTSLTESSTLQKAPPIKPQQQQMNNAAPGSPTRYNDSEATLTRQSAANQQQAPPLISGNTSDADFHIYQTPRRQYSQPQTSGQMHGSSMVNHAASVPQQIGTAQQYQYQVTEQSHAEGFAVPYQYSQPQQAAPLVASTVQKSSYSTSYQSPSQPVAVVEHAVQQQQFQQAYVQPAQQQTSAVNSSRMQESGGNASFDQQGTIQREIASSAQFRNVSSSTSAMQGTTAVDGQWMSGQGTAGANQQQQQSSSLASKRAGMAFETGNTALHLNTTRTLSSPSTLNAPLSAGSNRSISPSDMTLRARLQSRLESRSPGMAAMMAGGQTSPSVYFGQSRTGSLSSLEGGEVLMQSPRFVRDTSKLWHKPHISREEAIALLRDKPPGSFVVRNSNTFQGAFGLALKVAQIPPNVQIKEGGDPQSELVRHFLIEPTSKGVRLKGCNNEPVFGSLAALVYQHTITPLALPCKLLLPEYDIAGADEADSSMTGTANKSQLYVQGAACNVLYINSIDMESLTGPEALSRAIAATFPANGPPPQATDVHFKVSSEGITLTDNKHRLFFRRHYPINTITFCGVDARDRRWTLKFNEDQTMDCKVFGFVARKPGSSNDNACHVFAEMDPNQPANAIVNFLTKVMIGQGHFMKT